MNTPFSPVIDAKNISVRYGSRVVLNDVSMQVETKEIRVILGTSGCGKTTLLRTLVGLIVPFSGTVKLFGELMGELDKPQTTALLSRIGILFQNGALLGSMTVEENVALPLVMHTSLSDSMIAEIVALKLSQVGLSHAASRMPQELSGGMRKRAALARALALDPPLLFCDEPSAGLDPVTAAGLDDLLLMLREELSITVVVVTHELASIKRIADNIVFLHEGNVLYEGSLAGAEAMTSGPIADFFRRVSKAARQTQEMSDIPFLIEQTA